MSKGLNLDLYFDYLTILFWLYVDYFNPIDYTSAGVLRRDERLATRLWGSLKINEKLRAEDFLNIRFIKRLILDCLEVLLHYLFWRSRFYGTHTWRRGNLF